MRQYSSCHGISNGGRSNACWPRWASALLVAAGASLVNAGVSLVFLLMKMMSIGFWLRISNILLFLTILSQPTGNDSPYFFLKGTKTMIKTWILHQRTRKKFSPWKNDFQTNKKDWEKTDWNERRRKLLTRIHVADSPRRRHCHFVIRIRIVFVRSLQTNHWKLEQLSWDFATPQRPLRLGHRSPRWSPVDVMNTSCHSQWRCLRISWSVKSARWWFHIVADWSPFRGNSRPEVSSDHLLSVRLVWCSAPDGKNDQKTWSISITWRESHKCYCAVYVYNWFVKLFWQMKNVVDAYLLLDVFHLRFFDAIYENQSARWIGRFGRFRRLSFWFFIWRRHHIWMNL